MSLNATSPHPERPIRPLPRCRLHERLPPDVAESIKCPLAPKNTTSLFREDARSNGVKDSQYPSERERAYEVERNYISRRNEEESDSDKDDIAYPRRNEEESDSDKDDIAYPSQIYPKHSADTSNRSYCYIQKLDSRNPNPQPPASTASSADGYDSFENTNDNKKRKTPTHGNSSLNDVVHISSDLAGIDISSLDETVAEDAVNGTGSYHNSGGISSQELSCLNRDSMRNDRSPLRTPSDTTDN